MAEDRIKASEDTKNIVYLRTYLSEAINMVATCVSSPNPAKKTYIYIVKKNLTLHVFVPIIKI